MKGQYFSFDAIIASVIFVLAIVALLSYWHSVRTYLDYQNNDISREAVRISNALFTPPAGECSSKTMRRLGFASSWSDKRFNQTIIDCIAHIKMPVDALKANLSTSFDLRIVITDAGTNTVVLDTGASPSLRKYQNPAEVVKMRRIATVQKEDGSNYIAAVDVYLYR